MGSNGNTATHDSYLYDNPHSMQRELWVDGRMVAFMSALLLVGDAYRASKDIPFMLKGVGPWNEGHRWGGSPVDKSLTPSQKAVLAELMAFQTFSRIEISTGTGLQGAALDKVFQALERRNFICKTDEGGYRLTPFGYKAVMG